MRLLKMTMAVCTMAAIALGAQAQEDGMNFSSFDKGAYEVEALQLSKSSGSPVEMDLYLPVAEVGQPLPLVYMNHGFLVQNQYYSRILRQIASHGFAVIAPQMYGRSPLPFGKPSLTKEAQLGEQIIAWSLANLGTLTNRTIATDAVALMGHSRGGHVSWNIAARSSLNIAAVIGLDPVDGARRDAITDSVLASVPSLTIGAGLGGSCAPEGRNYKNFYGSVDQNLEQWLIIGENFGHMDMLDGSCGLPCSLCKKASANYDKDQFVTAVAGSTIAFLKRSLSGNTTTAAEVNAYFELQSGYRVLVD